jgi:hypothetical protein
LETSEVASQAKQPPDTSASSKAVEKDEPQVAWRRVVYTMKDRKLSKREL